MFLGIKSVFAIGAHADDVEYGCLGTLLRLGPNVAKHVFVASVGSVGDKTATPARAGESRRALGCLGAIELHIREKAGVPASDFVELEQELRTRIAAAQPDVILTLGPDDTHQEHRLVWEIAQAAARQIKASVLQYGIVSNTPDFAPNVFVDISAQYDIKLAALRAHVSQAGKRYMSEEYLRHFHANAYAALHGLSCAETFRLVRALL